MTANITAELKTHGFGSVKTDPPMPVLTSTWTVRLSDDSEKKVFITLLNGVRKGEKDETDVEAEALEKSTFLKKTTTFIQIDDDLDNGNIERSYGIEVGTLGALFRIQPGGFHNLHKNLHVTKDKASKTWQKIVSEYLIGKLTPTAGEQLLKGAAADRKISLARTDSMESRLDELLAPEELDISDDDQELKVILEEELPPPPAGTPPPPSRSPSPAEQAAGPADAPKPKEETPKKGSLVGRVTKFVIGQAGKGIGMLRPKKVFSCSKATWLSIGAAVASVALFSLGGRIAAQYNPWND